jgi:hypothetical protein
MGARRVGCGSRSFKDAFPNGVMEIDSGCRVVLPLAFVLVLSDVYIPYDLALTCSFGPNERKSCLGVHHSVPLRSAVLNL